MIDQRNSPLFTLSPKLLARWLIIATIMNTMAGWLSQLIVYFWEPPHPWLWNLFNLDAETNIPTFYSCGLFGIAGGFSLLLAAHSSQTDGRHLWHWRGLGVLFGLMAIDDFVQFHERIQGAVIVFDTLNAYIRWLVIVVGIVVVFILVIAYLKFLIQLPAKWRWPIFFSGVVFVSGAYGMDELGWAQYTSFGGYNLPYLHMAVVEETLENVAIVWMIHTLAQYLHSVGATQLIALKQGRDA